MPKYKVTLENEQVGDQLWCSTNKYEVAEKVANYLFDKLCKEDYLYPSRVVIFDNELEKEVLVKDYPEDLV